ncbi:MAG: hypothetical protein CM15mP83_9350 [Flavobacteriaceae bacterium]|nr:MAG: hypothetical protein CM15mP83_9350 [Flavobacteriaceae bacterium]
MSAYDKTLAMPFMAKENYVSEERLNKMLDLESNTSEKEFLGRSIEEKYFYLCQYSNNNRFFPKKFKGHGWMGIKFQTEPNGPYSMISTHLRFHEINARSQQESVGVCWC